MPASAKSPADEGAPLPTLRLPRYSQSLELGLAILGCFTPTRHMLGIADISDELGMSPSTTHRYMATLQMLGYLEQGKNRKYRLGLRVTDIGMLGLKVHPVRCHARPYLEQLRQDVRYTVGIAVLDGDQIILLDRLPGFRGHARLELDLGLASRLPAYCTSMGKVLLAHLPRERQECVLRELTLTPHGPNTIKRKDRLRAELAKVRAAGFAVADEELAAGVRSMAMPLCSEKAEVVGAVNVSAPTSMIQRKEMIQGFGPDLKSTAERISVCLGHRPNDEHQDDG
jgi:IclR family pca regulon transcriptional regulator